MNRSFRMQADWRKDTIDDLSGGTGECKACSSQSDKPFCPHAQKLKYSLRKLFCSLLVSGTAAQTFSPASSLEVEE